MANLTLPLVGTALLAGGLVGAFWLWQRQRRSFSSTASVAAAYDRWTEDQLLERLWGEHVHLGHYGNPPRRCDFRAAKASFVNELVRWSGLDQLPPGSRVLDVGCGIGGSARILARDYGFNVLGISISPAQIARAQALTPAELTCRFAVMDALALDLEPASFDAVWSVEAGPHMPDKQRYADELLRVLKPAGLLAVADWNRRDPTDGHLNRVERWVMRQLLEQWAHPEFASIRSLQHNLETSPWGGGIQITTGDWSRQTQPSWIESILEGVRRPGAVLGLGPGAALQGLRETPTLLLMDWAFRTGMMQFGVFRGRKGS
ncbi:methyltransferase domain-containing protein [Synechococcus sp. CCY9201]|jgi:MPBQ/MSBQ methyltransferase|uniref:methyltransferase domain-containing protein n=1 Tax=unclassified Synechococcus TaxID=2626047 RepID=UPI0018CC82BA|nr:MULTISPECIES: methyltransferase domain-containing protein [unclassified Synechococcus]MEA5474403.1 methyltransferase domain-containing protein [Synechococcus sp. CCY9201]QPN61189.1 methyltransferase domain-containing protein [Synechococcus sp. CBW1002]CAK6701449.1 2-methyl-6-phytyl-1,4-hydroquinone methyltransferase [Synechococcus sp. CBW1107]